MSRGCAGLHSLDDLVDRANRQVLHEVLGYVHIPRRSSGECARITVARCFERIGDNAVDIGEQTAFLVTGEFAEFTDASHVTHACLVIVFDSLTTRATRHQHHQPIPPEGANGDDRVDLQSNRRMGTKMEARIATPCLAVAGGSGREPAIVSAATGAGPTYNSEEAQGLDHRRRLDRWALHTGRC